MTDTAQSNRVLCEGGLDSTLNHINLSINKPGAATRLINYEPGLDGGYRRILGYKYYDTAFPEVGATTHTGAILGVIIFDNSVTGTTQIIAARKAVATATYSLFLYVSGTGWTTIVTGLTLVSTNVTRLRWDVGNDGSRNFLAIVDGVNKAILYDGSTWAQINSASTGANLANAGGAQAVNAPSLVSFFEQTLFIGGDASAKGVIAYSSPNAFYDFRSANGAGQLTIGFPVVQYKPFRDKLFIFGNNAIKSAVADVTTGFLVDGVTTNIGCIAPDSVVEVGGDLIFLAPDGFRPISGTSKIGDVQLEVLSKPIHELLKTRITTVVDVYTCAVVLRSKSQFRVFFPLEATTSTSSRGILGGLRTADQQTGWEFSELLGFKPSCVTSRYIGSNEVVLHGGFDGMIYVQETGNTLNGTNMLGVYATPYLDFGDSEVRKVIEKITLFLKAENALNISMEISYDWGDPTVSSPSPYDLDLVTSATVYGPEYLYGDPDAIYGAITQSRLIQNIEGSFFSIRATFTTYGNIAPYSIHGIIYEYQVKGRR